MPRRSGNYHSRPINPIDKEKYKGVQQLLDEDSDSSFRSASTDAGATQYNLDYTTRSSSHRQKNSKNASTSREPPATNPPSGRASAQKSTSSRARVSSPEPEESEIARENSSTSSNRQSQQRRSLRRSTNSGQNETNSPQRQQPDRPPAGSSKRKTKRPVRHDRVWKEIQRLQHNTAHLIPRLPFSRVMREIMLEEASSVTKVTPAALMALQEAAETYLVHLFQDSYMCTLHRARVTLMIKDIELVRYLRGRLDPGNL